MFVIKTNEILEINKVYGNTPLEDTTDYDGNPQRLVFKVVAIASLEDYYQSVLIEAGILRSEIKPEWVENKNFYFVQPD